MKKHIWTVLLILFVYAVTGGSTCQVKTCPPEFYNYKLYHLSERGFSHIFKIEQDCSGCHHVVAERCGLVKLRKIKEGKNHVFTAKVEKIKGNSCTKAESTFFPENWSVQTTLDKIEEAYKNSHIEPQDTQYEYDDEDSETEKKVSKNKHTNEIRLGKTSEGVKIKIVMDNKNPKKIFNAYPILEE